MPLVIHFLNVGHGDCTFIELPSGRLMMIDINRQSRPRPAPAAARSQSTCGADRRGPGLRSLRGPRQHRDVRPLRPGQADQCPASGGRDLLGLL